MKKLSHHKEIHHDIEEIVINNLSFGYSKHHLDIKDISLRIHKGEWNTIIGPNGSGKSTLAKNIVRINNYKDGEILIDGKNLKEYKNREYARRVAYIPQMIEIPDGTKVYEYVSFGRNPWLSFTSKMSEEDHKIVHDALKKVGAFHLKDKMIEDLSGGQRQKVVVAMAIAQTAQTIILDEPTTYLDIRAQYELLELMNQLHLEGKTIVAVLHDINQAVQYSDEITVLKDGKVYSSGKPEKIVTTKMLKDVFDVDTEFHTSKGRQFMTDVKLIKK